MCLCKKQKIAVRCVGKGSIYGEKKEGHVVRVIYIVGQGRGGSGRSPARSQAPGVCVTRGNRGVVYMVRRDEGGQVTCS